MKTTLAYQGQPGSNAERAARAFARRSLSGFSSVDLIPCTSSVGVYEAMRDGRAFFGTMATENSIAGSVDETEEAKNAAMKSGGRLEEVDSDILNIHHCAFIHPDAEKRNIEVVASHPSALRQTRRFRDTEMIGCEVLEMPDTALSAMMLASGELPKSTVVICSREAGEMNGLKMTDENIEDDESKTRFGLFILSRPGQRPSH